MAIDRDRIEHCLRDLRYWIDGLRQADASRKRKVLVLGIGGLVLAVLVIVRLVPLLPSKPTDDSVSRPVSPEVAAAQKAVSPGLESDARFAGVRVLSMPPSDAEPKGQLMVMGSVASEADLKQLQQRIGTEHPGVPVNWQVGVAPAGK